MSVKKINLLIKNNIAFRRRVVMNIFDFGFIFLFSIAIISLYKALVLPLLVVLVLLMYYSFRRYLESKVYISEIYLQSHELVIKYFLRDEIITEEIPVESFKVDFFDSVIGNFVKCRLVFYNNNQVVLKQFNVGDWSRGSLKTFKDEIQKKVHNLSTPGNPG